MTPKGLLRLKEASSALDDLAHGRFEPVLDDPSVADRAAVTRLVLTSGKLYYDISEASSGARRRTSPSPASSSCTRSRSIRREARASYPGSEVVWAQEEPQNMGPWRAIRHRLEEALAPSVGLRFVGRPWRASPSEGYPTSHLRAQDRIVREVLEEAT